MIKINKAFLLYHEMQKKAVNLIHELYSAGTNDRKKKIDKLSSIYDSFTSKKWMSIGIDYTDDSELLGRYNVIVYNDIDNSLYIARFELMDHETEEGYIEGPEIEYADVDMRPTPIKRDYSELYNYPFGFDKKMNCWRLLPQFRN